MWHDRFARFYSKYMAAAAATTTTAAGAAADPAN
jgi:hypothetical protein